MRLITPTCAFVLRLAALLTNTTTTAFLTPPKLLATNPITLVFDDFATPAECASLLTDPTRYVAISPAESTDPYHPTLSTLAARLGTITGVPPHPHEIYRRAVNGRTPPGETDRLHVDTNNGKLATFATGICYLTDVPLDAGGGTSFPLADASEWDPGLDAARELGDANVHHVGGEGHGRAIRVLEGAVGRVGGLTVRPKVGRLLLFYGREEGGGVDPRAWHRGDPILGDEAVKGIAVFLKEVPQEHLGSAESFNHAVRRYVRHGHAIAKEAGGYSAGVRDGASKLL